jgi:1-acyl-sn-glycerol-3-phosphate acyltransferase
LFFLFGTVFYVGRYLLKAVFLGHDMDRGLRLRKEWIGYVLARLGIKVTIEGEVPTGGGLIVSNHRSYIDPVVLLHRISGVPVAKKEVRSWPIIGYAVNVSGAVFVDRSSKESRKETRKAIRKAIENDYFVINYPEGTTHKKPQTIPFKVGAFVDAAKEGFPVYPVAVDFRDADDAWVGNDTFLRHFLECFGKPTTHVRIRYGEEIRGHDAEVILKACQTFINQGLREFPETWKA